MLVDRLVLARIVDAAHLSKDETVLEAGTGQGILTEELCKVAKSVISYEVDKRLHQQVQGRLRFHNLELVNADLFKTTTGVLFDVFVSNLPYSRSRDAFEWLAMQKFSRGIVMVQEEFANKLVAEPGNKDYRSISALASYCFSIEKLFSVGRHSFEPKPKVKSALIRITWINTVTKETIKALNLLFSKRNKRASTVTSKARVQSDFGSKRIGQLAPIDLIRIAESISNVHPI
jgi:16S rRNA (adenine1518-N6/adenine1519-N6)-dimethyltransferase